ncbi:MAG: sugar transferase, partial [Thermoflexibacteraceae bacterium]
MLAPIILFVYNRPFHTQQTLLALAQNDWAAQSTLIIYADGAKNKETEAKVAEVRQLIRQKQWCKEVIIRESSENKGLTRAILEGVTEVINKYGKAIVL